MCVSVQKVTLRFLIPLKFLYQKPVSAAVCAPSHSSVCAKTVNELLSFRQLVYIYHRQAHFKYCKRSYST